MSMFCSSSSSSSATGCGERIGGGRTARDTGARDEYGCGCSGSDRVNSLRDELSDELNDAVSAAVASSRQCDSVSSSFSCTGNGKSFTCRALPQSSGEYCCGNCCKE